MTVTFDTPIPFFKMQGSGNDFVAIDNRELKVPESLMADWAIKLCRRAFGVCSDGMFFLEIPEDTTPADVIWHFFNSDGSRAEMCGNGSRCAARLASELGMAPAEFNLGTDAGIIACRYLPELQQARVRMVKPTDLQTDLDIEVDGVKLDAHVVNTGVPHAVVFVDDVAAVDISKWGPAVRYHDLFAPAGANANFVQIKDDGSMLIRTYERGVEDETYACGTGSCASLFIANALGRTGTSASLTSSGGEVLRVDIEDGYTFLQGGAEIVFSGTLNLESQGLTL